jgi:hypothetical protein
VSTGASGERWPPSLLVRVFFSSLVLVYLIVTAARSPSMILKCSSILEKGGCKEFSNLEQYFSNLSKM